jgi:hypothetical protein
MLPLKNLDNVHGIIFMQPNPKGKKNLTILCAFGSYVSGTNLGFYQIMNPFFCLILIKVMNRGHIGEG